MLNPSETRYPVTLRVFCRRIAVRLYRCSFFGETTNADSYVYVLRGSSKVQFTGSGTRTTLHGVACATYSLADYITYDFC
jgi:hypothetical protein